MNLSVPPSLWTPDAASLPPIITLLADPRSGQPTTIAVPAPAARDGTLNYRVPTNWATLADAHAALLSLGYNHRGTTDASPARSKRIGVGGAAPAQYEYHLANLQALDTNYLQVVRIADLVIDQQVQSRAQPNIEAIDRYAEAYRRGDKFPPLIVFRHGTALILADGFTRAAAATAAGINSHAAYIYVGDLRAATLHAAAANLKHGALPTDADRRHAASRLLTDPEWSQWSDREISRRTGYSRTSVAKLRESLAARTPDAPPPADTRTYTRAGVTQTMRTQGIGSRPARVGSAASAPEATDAPPPSEPARRIDDGGYQDAIATAIAARAATRAERNTPGAHMRVQLATLGIHADRVVAHKDGSYTAAWWETCNSHADARQSAAARIDAFRRAGIDIIDTGADLDATMSVMGIHTPMIRFRTADPNAAAPTPAPSSRYAIGDRVQVTREDGSVTTGTIRQIGDNDTTTYRDRRAGKYAVHLDKSRSTHWYPATHLYPLPPEPEQARSTFSAQQIINARTGALRSRAVIEVRVITRNGLCFVQSADDLRWNRQRQIAQMRIPATGSAAEEWIDLPDEAIAEFAQAENLDWLRPDGTVFRAADSIAAIKEPATVPPAPEPDADDDGYGDGMGDNVVHHPSHWDARDDDDEPVVITGTVTSPSTRPAYSPPVPPKVTYLSIADFSYAIDGHPTDDQIAALNKLESAAHDFLLLWRALGASGIRIAFTQPEETNA
jgi:hypothetical protein